MPKEEPENDLCRCCHAEGAFKNLYESYSWMDVEEVVYSKLLLECFEVEMAPVTQPLQHMLCTICETCIERLQDAVKFKRQVLKCEKRFRDVYGSCVGGETKLEVKVKEEIEVDLKDDSFNGESSKANAVADTLRMMDDDDDDDDDDGFGDRDDEHFNMSGDVKVKQEVDNSDSEDNICLKDVGKSRKRKAKGASPGAAQKKSKAASGEKTGDDEELEVIQENAPRAGKETKKKNNKKKNRSLKSSEPAEDVEEIGTIDGVPVIKVKNGVRARKGIDFKGSKDMLQCLRCPKTTRRYKAMLEHIKSVHFNAARYRCPTCLENFWTLGDLVKHKLDAHNIDERFKCNACGKAFYGKISLTYHNNSFHMLGEKMKCKECSFETFNRNSFNNHKRIHSSERNHKCDYCEKAFKTRHKKKLHEMIHTGEKRKPCTECERAFIDTTSLKYHMTRHHPGIAF